MIDRNGLYRDLRHGECDRRIAELTRQLESARRIAVVFEQELAELQTSSQSGVSQQ